MGQDTGNIGEMRRLQYPAIELNCESKMNLLHFA